MNVGRGFAESQYTSLRGMMYLTKSRQAPTSGLHLFWPRHQLHLLHGDIQDIIKTHLLQQRIECYVGLFNNDNYVPFRANGLIWGI